MLGRLTCELLPKMAAATAFWPPVKVTLLNTALLFCRMKTADAKKERSMNWEFWMTTFWLERVMAP